MPHRMRAEQPRMPQPLVADVTVLPAPIEAQLEALEEQLGDNILEQPLPELVLDEELNRRIVVTGLGIVSPIGNDIPTFWDSLSNGRSGLQTFTLIPNYRAYPTHVGGEVKDFDPRTVMDHKEARRVSRASHFAVAAARQAMADARITAANGDDEIGVLFGCGTTSFPDTENAMRILIERGGSRVNPFFMTAALPNMPAAQVAIHLGLRGYNSTISTACAASSQAIGEAAEVLLRGDAEVMLAGGTEAPICELTLAAFGALRALSTGFNDDPAAASRPFDLRRDGFVPGEGAAVLVLETLAHAQRRGATIHAELLGYSATSDAYHVTAPDPVGQGAARAMVRAMRRARVTPQQIDYINAHATSTPSGDAAEVLAIKAAFGEYATTIPVSSTKSMMGHLTGGAGAVEAVATVLALKHGLLPPTINYETPDPACDIDCVPNTARPSALSIAMSNSFGFGGQNAALVFKKWQPRISPAEQAMASEFAGRLDEQ
ncbi:MAG: beta-ketoacyl-ACP synthase II [Herpetosiphon sp.]